MSIDAASQLEFNNLKKNGERGMNLKEAKQLLTILWAMYPNAPKLSREDKELTARAWVGLMYEYSLEDVWKAVKQRFELEPRFVPSAPEVLKKCEKDYKVERYLPPEYDELAACIDRSWAATVERENLYQEFRRKGVDSLDGKAKALYHKIAKERETERRLDKMFKEAYDIARTAYGQRERAKLAEDGTAERITMLLRKLNN